MAQEYLPLYFDAEGYPVNVSYGQAVIDTVLNAPKPISDVWIMSHGWNNDIKGGDQTYRDWIKTFKGVIQQEMSGDPSYNPLFVGIHWPSRAWAGDIAKEAAKRQQRSQGGGEGEFEIAGGVSGVSPAAKARFVAEYRPVMDADGIHGRAFTRDWGRLYQLMYQPLAPTPAQIEEFVKILKKYTIRDPHSDPAEESNIVSAPVKDITTHLQAQIPEIAHPEQFEGFFLSDALLEFFRLFSFWQMKGRAAIVGETGVYAFLVALKQAISQHNLKTRLHLLGHSFGAKLVTAAVYPAAGAASVTPPLVNTIVLLMGAFSQFSFSSRIPLERGAAGRYAAVLERGLVANPVVVIYSRHDMANGTIYPIGMKGASPVSSQIYELGGRDETAEAFVASKDRFGALGANGAQGLADKQYRAIDMLPTGQAYDWSNLEGVLCLNVDGQQFIKRGGPPVGAHGDILQPEIYHLALAMSLR